jgi:hypothetical protein
MVRPLPNLRSRIVLERRQDVSDGHGNVKGDFAAEFEAWAEIRPRLGGERALAGRLESRALMNITVRQEPRTNAIGPEEWRAYDTANPSRRFNLRSRRGMRDEVRANIEAAVADVLK